MFQFVGYHAFGGPDALSNAPSQVDEITTTRIQNAIFDHYNATKNTSIEFTTTIPTAWDYDTIMDANFEGDIDAGNVDFILSQISSIVIKRRIVGTFDWLTLETIPVNSLEDLTFVFEDKLNAYGIEYEYAFVPIIEGIEGNYIINSIMSKFDGVYIGDYDSIFRFFYGVQYGTNVRNQIVGTFTPLGRQYPIVVANGLINYDSGTVTGMVLNDDYDETGKLDLPAIVAKKEFIKTFLTNKKPKILKDWTGQIWLVMITDSPQITYADRSGLRVPSITFNWTEVGDANTQSDLYNNGILDIPG